ncbi:hypothetical protein ACXWO5_09945, partial [Streptococcus pyogenes]
YLAIENEDGLPFDFIMMTALHSIWRSRMAGFHCDPDRRPAREHFKESISRLLEVVRTDECVPIWVERVEALLTMKEF